jgi:regulator of nucleoside diphosphate kinase
MLAELDLARLKKMCGGHWPVEPANGFETLNLVASREIPSDVVPMHSRVGIADPNTRRRKKLAVCFPSDAAQWLVSSRWLHPPASSWLGLKADSVAGRRTPRGGERAANVAALRCEREASIDHST